jgi:hypothetical protein
MAPLWSSSEISRDEHLLERDHLLPAFPFVRITFSARSFAAFPKVS